MYHRDLPDELEIRAARAWTLGLLSWIIEGLEGARAARVQLLF